MCERERVSVCKCVYVCLFAVVCTADLNCLSMRVSSLSISVPPIHKQQYNTSPHTAYSHTCIISHAHTYFILSLYLSITMYLSTYLSIHLSIYLSLYTSCLCACSLSCLRYLSLSFNRQPHPTHYHPLTPSLLMLFKSLSQLFITAATTITTNTAL